MDAPTRDEPPPLPREAFRPEESPRAEVDLECDVCGAPLRWSPEAGALHCEHCEAVHAVEVAEGTILERPLDEAAASARGLGRSVRVTECSNCGARVSFEGASTSEQCPFCGSPEVLAQEANRNAVRPESLIPLEVGKAKVDEAFRKWITSRWFRPSALKNTKRFDAIGVYVPAWTYDARVHSEWSAQSGTYYYVTESYSVTVNGRRQRRTRRVRKVRWWPSWGRRDDAHDDVLVVASKGIDAGLAKSLGPFAAEGLVPYSPSYLAGWRAEEYQIDLLNGWDRARAEIQREQRRRCAGDVPGDTHRALRVQNTYSNVRWKHVLLPMWSVTYRFKDKHYAVLVHGQSGRLVGRAPYSWVKILLAILLAALLIGGVLLIAGAL